MNNEMHRELWIDAPHLFRSGYYVNVHTNLCQPGVIRGQLGDRGPSNN